MLCQASREQYCVNKAVTSKPSISEECDRLLGGDGLSCSYHSNFNRLLGSSLADKLKVSLVIRPLTHSCRCERCCFSRTAGLCSTASMQVHDIEDLAAAGTANHACPYFAARSLAGTPWLLVFSHLVAHALRDVRSCSRLL